MKTETKLRGIVLADFEAKALAEGRLSVLVRAVKPGKLNQEHWNFVFDRGQLFRLNRDNIVLDTPCGRPAKAMQDRIIPCPLGRVGERVWWQIVGHPGIEPCDPRYLVYRSNWPDCIWKGFENVPPLEEMRWRSSAIMPQWASRFAIEIKGVEAKRLQELTEEEARAAGIQDGGCLNCGESSFPNPCGCADPKPDFRESFAWQWLQDYKPPLDWHSNPWVWIVTIERQSGEG